MALAATLATAEALVSLLELVRPIVERRALEDVRFSRASAALRLALRPGGGTPVAIREVLDELGGDK